MDLSALNVGPLDPLKLTILSPLQREALGSRSIFRPCARVVTQLRPRTIHVGHRESPPAGTPGGFQVADTTKPLRLPSKGLYFSETAMPLNGLAQANMETPQSAVRPFRVSLTRNQGVPIPSRDPEWRSRSRARPYQIPARPQPVTGKVLCWGLCPAPQGLSRSTGWHEIELGCHEGTPLRRACPHPYTE